MTGGIFQYTQTNPASELPHPTESLPFYLQLQIDLDRSVLKPFHQESENKEARREGWGSYILPPSLCGAVGWGCWVSGQLPIVRQNATRDVRRISWPREALCISLQKRPSQACLATSVLLSSKQRICTALRQALTLAE